MVSGCTEAPLRDYRRLTDGLRDDPFFGSEGAAAPLHDGEPVVVAEAAHRMRLAAEPLEVGHRGDVGEGKAVLLLGQKPRAEARADFLNLFLRS